MNVRSPFQRDIENRKLVAAEEADRRLALDSVVKGLELLVAEGKYAPKARIAGALGALVHLDHPVIAMRALSAAWDEGAVDNATACWLIGEVLSRGSDEASREAAILLRRHATKLPRDEGNTEWPLAVRFDWPLHVPADTRARILYALADMLLSHNKKWWADKYGWVINLLDEAYRRDPFPANVDFAARMLGVLLSTQSREGVIGYRNETKDLAEMNQALLQYRQTYTLAGDPKDLIDRLEDWADETAAHAHRTAMNPRRLRLKGRQPPSGRP